MSETSKNPDFVMNPGEKTEMLFMQMVFQMSSLATMLLGKVPHPETGKTVRDLDAAQLIIDQLDMLQVKTKGNLNSDEDKLLRQTLTGLRMAYVEAVGQPEAGPPQEHKDAESPETASSAPADTSEAASAESEESKKRFSKKY